MANFRYLLNVAAPVDTDGDGMPDKWEQENGLDPNDPSDGAKATASGFTNLEIYPNSLVGISPPLRTRPARCSTAI